VSSLVFEEHWTYHYGSYNDWNFSIDIKVTDFHDTVETKKVEAPKTGEIPPWIAESLNTADQLTNCNNKHEPPHAVLALSNDVIDTYSKSVRVYTDASKTSDSIVGVGCYFEPTRGSAEMRLAHRVTDHVQKMAAIRLDIQTAGQFDSTALLEIFIDSLSAVRLIELEPCKRRSNLLLDEIKSKHATKSKACSQPRSDSRVGS